MFFLDDDLCRRRVQDIKLITAGRVEQRRGIDRRVHDVEMLDGTKLVILDVTAQQISKTPILAFAAQPGTMAWAPGTEGGNDFLNPIVGWGVTVDGNITPIAAGGSINDCDPQAVVVAPDGQIWQNGLVQAADLGAYKLLIAEE